MREMLEEFNRLNDCVGRFEKKYRIKQTIKQTAMSKVLLIEDESGMLLVAKKVANDRRELLKEYDLLKNIDCEHLPKVYEIIEEIDYSYIIMAYIDGVTLQEVINERKQLTEMEVINFGIQICSILKILHDKKMIHRDIKPENIMISHHKLYLIDFNAARAFNEQSDSDTVVIGTRGFASPEQYGYCQTDTRTDIYSLGATMHYLLTGETLFRDNRGSGVEHDIHKDLRNIIEKCMSFNPQNRYANVSILSKKLENAGSRESGLSNFKGWRFFVAGCFVGILLIFLQSQNIVNINKDILDKSHKPAGVTDIDQTVLALDSNAEITFQDPAFEEVVRQLLNKNTSDKMILNELDKITQIFAIGNSVIIPGADGSVSFNYSLSNQINGQDYISVYFLEDGSSRMERGGIQSLEDVKYLRNLRVLDLKKQRISDLSPLKNLKYLTNINFTDNYISDLTPIAEQKSLVGIICDGNQIEDIDPLESIVEQLFQIGFASNDITNSDLLSKARNLSYINMSNNNIDKYPDLSQLKDIKEVNFDGNPCEFTKE